MMHVVVGEKSLLLGDEVTALLLQYAALLGRVGSADTLELTGFTALGAPTRVSFLLNEGLTLVAEAVETQLSEPDNLKAEQHLRSAIGRLVGGPSATPEEVAGSALWNAPDDRAEPRPR